MTTPQLVNLMRFLNSMTVEEMDEVRKLVTNLIGVSRSQKVLLGKIQRPGKRGKRWAKKETKP